MGRHSHWRDCQAWRDEGLEMSSTCNEAVKLYDASLSQVVGWYEEPSVGGFMACITNMLQADETFVMGHVLEQGMKFVILDQKSPLEDSSSLAPVEALVALSEKPETRHREKLHVNAIKLLAEDRMQDALSVWQEILMDHPTDMLAIKLSEMGYFQIGDLTQQRDFKYRVFPEWKPEIPLYNYLFGMMAYGEMETNMYTAAEKNAQRGIDGNPLDGWATHALAHVLDHQGRYEKGIDMLTSTVQNWGTVDMIACHTHWHLSLFYLEKGDFDSALQYYDSQVKGYNKIMFHAVDRASILLRFELEGVDVGDRWSDVYNFVRPHLEDHNSSFNDAHCVMACLGAKHRQDAQDMLQSMQQFIKTSPTSSRYHRVASSVGTPLCEALVAWDDKDFAQVTELLYPIRNQTNQIAGSNAQRDVFSQLLIHSALQSPDKRHQAIARSLINERKCHKDTPLTERLMSKLMSSHDDGHHCDN